MVTQRQLPADRYGSRAKPPAPRWLRWAGLALFVALGLVVAVIGYQNLGTQPIETEGVDRQVIDDGSVRISFSVRRDDPAKPADCIVRARSADGDESGRREVYIAPGGTSVTVTTVLHTSKRAVSGEVFGCSYQVPAYLVAP
ncbi:DUF4307 domain-containing protein [Kutzneria viridogrisea]|uniref:DUF4307 domain-containing protein n=1 Tax=Kutzneria viridogrisea TaxID=47990 RepID=A0ABR6BSL8_9PSEU|nr:hypothetical protein [Kutzneria viridogrisea]